MVNAWLRQDSARLARLVAVGRVALGIGMVVRPELLPRLLGVDSGTARRMSWLGRMFGAREVALGAGLLTATRSGAPGTAAGWLAGAALSDGVDAVAFAAAVRQGVVRPVLGSAFVGTAALAAGTEVAAWLDGRTDPDN